MKLVMLIMGLLTTATTLVQAADLKDVINPARAKYHYQLFCMGCHTPDGAGNKHVPAFKNFVGTFLRSNEGRDYLVQVPGSANSAMNDEQLAEVLNWILIEFGQHSLPPSIRPYTAEEVGRLRQNPLLEVLKYRDQVLSRIDRVKSL